MDPTREKIFSRVASLMEDLFGVEAAAIRSESSPDTLPQWDSLKHMSLIAALEEEFGIQFAPEEMSEMLNVDIILDIIAERK
jgi:acyl carrier protein